MVGVIERSSKSVYAKVMKPNELGQKLTGVQLLAVIEAGTAKGTTVVSDDFKSYGILDMQYDHKVVNHSKGQYCAGKDIHTNNIENFWSILKRSIIGVYHKTSEKYLQRYIDEACYRRTNMRNPHAFARLLKQAVTPKGNNAWRVAS